MGRHPGIHERASDDLVIDQGEALPRLPGRNQKQPIPDAKRATRRPEPRVSDRQGVPRALVESRDETRNPGRIDERLVHEKPNPDGFIQREWRTAFYEGSTLFAART